MKRSASARDVVISAGRLSWIAVTALALGLLILSIPAGLDHIQDESLFVDVSNYAIPAWLSNSTLALYFFILRYAALLVFLAMGLLVFWRRSRDPMGLLTAFVLVLLPSAVLRFGGSPDYWRLPGLWDRSLSVADTVLAMLGLLATGAFLYLFPNGRFVPRRLWLVPVLIVGALLVWGAVQSAAAGEPNWDVVTGAATAVAMVAVIGQAARYRHANPVVRQQLRWVLAGLAAYPLWALIHWVLDLPDYAFRMRGIVSFVLLQGDVLVPTVLPVALAVATLRYHLWDIDLVIRRTLTYGIVTGALSFVFFLSAVAFQRFFAGLTAQGSPVALVGSTLVIAALFDPLRRRVQAGVDRRFYRRKYDARKVLADFGRMAQSETDVEKLTEGLAAAVRDSVHPAKLGVWLRK